MTHDLRKGKEIPLETKSRAAVLLKQGLSVAVVSERLRISKTAVKRIRSTEAGNGTNGE